MSDFEDRQKGLTKSALPLPLLTFKETYCCPQLPESWGLPAGFFFLLSDNCCDFLPTHPSRTKCSLLSS